MRARPHCLLVCLCLLPGTALASKVTITTEPTGATVQLDGVAYGPSPLVLPKVDPGVHQLKVSLEGYVTREDALDVDGTSDFQIHAPLNPAPKRVEPPPPPPKPATPLPPPPPPPQPVRQQPPPPPPPVRAQVPVPVSELPVGWGTQKKTLVLVVETLPADAYVQVVGLEEVKRAPATFTGFAAGKVQLLVRAPGYRQKRVVVELNHDARTRVTLDRLP